MNPNDRIAGIRRRLAKGQTAAFAATAPANVVYLTGFDDVFDAGRDHIALVTADECVLITNALYAQAAREAAEAGGDVWRVEVAVRGEAWSTVASALPSEAVLAVEDSMPHASFLKVSGVFAERVSAVSDWGEELRAVKSPAELKRMELAQEITDRGFVFICGYLRPGVTEREIAIELESFMRREGSEGVAFPSIVASGPNS
ncbi:MAG: aminopeptidase P family N-terminal domain-containing protein, partial [Coriobacteriia bacterium]|nr:aminopeptidase P family N-terminal domain-containing protein [Coriobacteriia bacterium]